MGECNCVLKKGRGGGSKYITNMVGSYQLAQISRSYIAIPGSKSDIDTKTILYDISLGSHLAITVSVPGNTAHTSNFTSHSSPCK